MRSPPRSTRRAVAAVSSSLRDAAIVAVGARLPSKDVVALLRDTLRQVRAEYDDWRRYGSVRGSARGRSAQSTRAQSKRR